MAKKELQIGKRLKISEAQKNMFAAVVGASVALGASLVLGVYFLKMIRFNAKVISEKDDAIEGYSDAIETIGVCKKPRFGVYSQNELTSCSPNDIAVSDVSGSLRAKVMVDMAQNESLESVGRTGISVCTDDNTGGQLSYETLLRRYENSTTDEDKETNFKIFAMCSALRTVPDALPAAKNDLALMASLDKIFKLSNWEPETLSPGDPEEATLAGLGAIGVNITAETDVPTVIRILQNIEKSIREIGIQNASIEWTNGQLQFNAKATAYYTEVAGLHEGIETVTGRGIVTKALNGEEGIEDEDI